MRLHAHPESTVSSRLALLCEGLSKAVLMVEKIRASSNRYYKKILSQSIGEILDFTKSKNVLIEGVLKTQHFTEQNDIHRTQKTSLNILKCLVFLCCVLTLRATTVY